MLKHKTTLGLITATAVVAASALAVTARQKTERVSTPEYRQRVENSNPNFRPIKTMELENSLDPLGMSTMLPSVPGLLSFAKSAPQHEASDVPEIFGCVIASRANAEGVKHGVAMWSFKNDVFTQKKQRNESHPGPGFRRSGRHELLCHPPHGHRQALCGPLQSLQLEPRGFDRGLQ